MTHAYVVKARHGNVASYSQSAPVAGSVYDPGKLVGTADYGINIRKIIKYRVYLTLDVVSVPALYDLVVIIAY